MSRKRRKIKTVTEQDFPIREIRKGYFLVDYRKGGVNIRKAFSDLEEAKTFCRLKAIELKNKGTQAAVFPDRLRFDAIEASDILGDTPLVEAAKFYVQHHRPPGGTRNARDLADEYVTWLRDDMQRRPETVRAARWRLNVFSRTFGSSGVHEITTADIGRWLKKNRWEPLNRKHYLAVVHAFFEYARKQKLVSVNPAADVDQSEVQAQPPEIMTPAQVRKLFRKAEKLQPSLVPTFALSFFCGLRPSEIAGLDWKDVDLAEGFVRVIPSVAKMKRQRLVDLSPNAKVWLAPHCIETGSIQDFSQSAYRRRLAKVLEAAEIILPYNAGRHAFASYHFALNSPEETAKQMGHSRTDLVVTTYRGLVTKKTANTFWDIQPAARRMVIPLTKMA